MLLISFGSQSRYTITILDGIEEKFLPVWRKLNAAINKIVGNPETKARLAALGFDAFSGTTGEFAAFVAQQVTTWGDLIKGAGIQPE